MGTTTISYAIVASVVGIACLLAGFLWGRSNLQSKVEEAVEEGHAALDAREFAMRQQLDEAIAEIGRLRPLAEELGRLQDRLKVEQSKYERMKAEFDSTVNGGVEVEEASQEAPPPPTQPTMTPQSADEAIQRLLQSLETLNQPEMQADTEKIETPPPAAIQPPPASAPVAIADARSTPAPPQAIPLSQPRQIPPAPAKPSPAEVSKHVQATPVQATPDRPKPAEAQKPAQTPPAKPSQPIDEWQEFARSLAALTGRKQ